MAVIIVSGRDRDGLPQDYQAIAKMYSRFLKTEGLETIIASSVEWARDLMKIYEVQALIFLSRDARFIAEDMAKEFPFLKIIISSGLLPLDVHEGKNSSGVIWLRKEIVTSEKLKELIQCKA